MEGYASSFDLKLDRKRCKTQLLEYILTNLSNIVRGTFSSGEEMYGQYPLYLAYKLYCKNHNNQDPDKLMVSNWIHSTILERSSECMHSACYFHNGFWGRKSGSKMAKILSSIPEEILKKIFYGTTVTIDSILQAAFPNNNITSKSDRFIILKEEFSLVYSSEFLKNSNHYKTKFPGWEAKENLQNIHTATIKFLIKNSKRKSWAKSTEKQELYNKCILEINLRFNDLIQNYSFSNWILLLKCFMSYRLDIYLKKGSSSSPSIFSDSLRSTHEYLLTTIFSPFFSQNTTDSSVITELCQYKKTVSSRHFNAYKSKYVFADKNNNHLDKHKGLEIEKTLGKYFLKNISTNNPKVLPEEVRPTLRVFDSTENIAEEAKKERLILAALGNEEVLRHIYPCVAEENAHLYAGNESLYDVFFKNPEARGLLAEYPELLYSITLQAERLKSEFISEMERSLRPATYAAHTTP